MGLTLLLINHTRRQFQTLGTVGECNNLASDPNDFIKINKCKGWRYGDIVTFGEHSLGFRYIDKVYNKKICKCNACFGCIYNPNKKYWINKTRKEAIEINLNLSVNLQNAENNDWNIENDDIICYNDYNVKYDKFKYLS